MSVNLSLNCPNPSPMPAAVANELNDEMLALEFALHKQAECLPPTSQKTYQTWLNTKISFIRQNISEMRCQGYPHASIRQEAERALALLRAAAVGWLSDCTKYQTDKKSNEVALESFNSKIQDMDFSSTPLGNLSVPQIIGAGFGGAGGALLGDPIVGAAEKWMRRNEIRKVEDKHRKVIERTEKTYKKHTARLSEVFTAEEHLKKKESKILASEKGKKVASLARINEAEKSLDPLKEELTSLSKKAAASYEELKAAQALEKKAAEKLSVEMTKASARAASRAKVLGYFVKGGLGAVSAAAGATAVAAAGLAVDLLLHSDPVE